MKVSPITNDVLRLYHLSRIGVSISLDDINPEEAHYLEYYGMRRLAKDEAERFEALSKIIGGKK